MVTGDGANSSWANRIGLFERHYAAWKIESDGTRYTAQRKTPSGARGPKLKAATLDELAELIDEASP